MSIDEYRRRERAHFLRRRRENVAPTDVGLPEGVRRRTPGLRREEVAVLAGVSPTWYTYLEQARDVSPSPEVLDGLAEVLGLTPYERSYLHSLSRQGSCHEPRIGCLAESWKPLEDVVNHLHSSPAYICSEYGDLLSWNEAAAEWLMDFGGVPESRRNILLWLLTSESAPDRLVEWEDRARHWVARFRAEVPDWRASTRTSFLVRELSKASPHFHFWWEEHQVAGPEASVFHLRHPHRGIMAVRTVELLHTDPTGTARLIVHTPLGEIREEPALSARPCP
ncbi:helix-turn-helix transcriptional regulator [Streptomyces luteolus]|uniref:Helix-turn-helix transcriptional regulator n=1 Tax=Streptomyces luteolus TaxID=3043615 RepID=A0ABT6T7I3_9ACTN|nr:helix-turn-helix transcriptional regulator [Streptomyces sp. B-S-A12]MDI3423851.1 helix-turn-helix transcriptional regulator [Streptomyces sp. B-S-A12]